VVTGWTFLGWATSAARATEGTVDYTDAQQVLNLTEENGETIPLFAVWSNAVTYTVTYNSNKPDAASGTIGGSTADSTHIYDTARNLTTNGYTLTGWRFLGWATSAARANAGTVDYTDGAEVLNLTAVNNATVNLYAVWSELGNYNVTFLDFDGRVILSAEFFTGMDLWTEVKPSDPERSGFTFVRWEFLIKGMTVTSDHEFRAVYVANEDVRNFSLTFLNEDGTPYQTVGVINGQYVANMLPANPSAIGGREFLYWEGFSVWMVVNGNMTFKAVHAPATTPDTYEVTFKDHDGELLKTVEVAVGTEISGLVPANPVRAGYVFVGWDGLLAGMTVNGDHVFTAMYTAEPVTMFTVRFVLDDGVTVFKTDTVPE
jgi:uncharacterized repeat protein (TIGR02543 family)